MKFNLEEKHKHIAPGDIIFKLQDKKHYLIAQEFIETKYKYRLICLEQTRVLRKPFENLEDIIEEFLNDGEYKVIRNQDIILSN